MAKKDPPVSTVTTTKPVIIVIMGFISLAIILGFAGLGGYHHWQERVHPGPNPTVYTPGCIPTGMYPCNP